MEWPTDCVSYLTLWYKTQIDTIFCLKYLGVSQLFDAKIPYATHHCVHEASSAYEWGVRVEPLPIGHRHLAEQSFLDYSFSFLLIPLPKTATTTVPACVHNAHHRAKLSFRTPTPLPSSEVVQVDVTRECSIHAISRASSTLYKGDMFACWMSSVRDGKLGVDGSTEGKVFSPS